MTELTHALRALASSLKDRAQVGRGAGSAENAALLSHLGQACDDAADSLDHRWRQQNDRLTGKTKTCPKCVEPDIPAAATHCPNCKADLT